VCVCVCVCLADTHTSYAAFPPKEEPNLLKKQKKTLPPEPAVPVRSRTLSEVPALKICCARRTTERTGYKALADPDTVTEINVDSRGPSRNRRSRCQEASGLLPSGTRIHCQSLVPNLSRPKENAHLPNFRVLPPRAAKIIPSKAHRCTGTTLTSAAVIGVRRYLLRWVVGGERPTVPSATSRECRRLAEAFDQPGRDLLSKTKIPLRRALRSTSGNLEEG
jgi:hypothetical protein